jgi:hypothetical protein
MYCAFVDFEKAFDTIWRVALWYKLLLNKMNGKMYNFIVNIVLNHVLFIMITSQISFQVKWALDKE